MVTQATIDYDVNVPNVTVTGGTFITALAAALDKSQLPADLTQLNRIGVSIASDLTTQQPADGTHTTAYARRRFILSLQQPNFISLPGNAQLGSPQLQNYAGGFMVSSSPQDNPLGTGCKHVNLVYLDAGGGVHSVGLVPNGTTPVPFGVANIATLVAATYDGGFGALGCAAGRFTFYSGPLVAQASSPLGVAPTIEPGTILPSVPTGFQLEGIFNFCPTNAAIIAALSNWMTQKITLALGPCVEVPPVLS